jgi:hypothetical protein
VFVVRGNQLQKGTLMERKLLLAAVAIAWLTLPLTALNYSRAWDRLPPRIAIHFDANWQPNGWTSREGALELALATTGLLLVTFTFATFVASRKPASVVSRWAMIIVFYAAIGLVYRVNQWIVDRSIVHTQTTLNTQTVQVGAQQPRANRVRNPQL